MELAGALAHQGQLREALEMYDRAISVPGMKLKTIRQYRAHLDRVYSTRNSADIIAYRKAVIEDIHKAGMPGQ